MGLGALGAIAGGINRGMDWAQRDQEIEDQRAMRAEDREYQRGLRGFQQKQQQRQEDQWNKDDQFQQDQAAIPSVGAVKAVKDTDLGPEQVKQTDSGYYRDLGNALKKKGDVEGALKSWKWADEAASQAAANAVIGRLSSLPKTGTDLKRIVEEIGAGVDADESPVGIDYKNVRPNADGSVTVKAFNKRSGFSEDITVNSIADLKEKMTWHYAPDYAREMAKKQQEAASKTHEIQPGAKVVRGDGTVIATNDAEPAAVTAAKIRAGAVGASGAGAGAGKSGKVDDSPWVGVIDKLSTSEEDKPYRLPGAANAALINRLNSKLGLPPEVIGSIGLQYAKTPDVAKVTFDPDTGSWGKAVDFQGRRIVVNDRVSREEIEKAMPAQADALYTSLKSQGSPLLAAARDPAAREQFLANEENDVAIKIAKAQGKNATDPDVQKQAKSIIDMQARPKLDSITGLISKSALAVKDAESEKKAAAKASQPARTQPAPGGGYGLRPAMSPRQMDEAIAQQSRDWRANNKRTVVDEAAAKQDPQIRQLEADISRLLRDGRQGAAIEANNRRAEIERIKREKYMVQR